MHKDDLRRSAVVLMADETKSSSDGSPPEPKSLLGLESEGRPELITVEAEPEIESISSLRLERIDDGPQLEVALSIEAWVVPTRGGRS